MQESTEWDEKAMQETLCTKNQSLYGYEENNQAEKPMPSLTPYISSSSSAKYITREEMIASERVAHIKRKHSFCDLSIDVKKAHTQTKSQLFRIGSSNEWSTPDIEETEKEMQKRLDALISPTNKDMPHTEMGTRSRSQSKLFRIESEAECTDA